MPLSVSGLASPPLCWCPRTHSECRPHTPLLAPSLASPLSPQRPQLPYFSRETERLSFLPSRIPSLLPLGGTALNNFSFPHVRLLSYLYEDQMSTFNPFSRVLHARSPTSPTSAASSPLPRILYQAPPPLPHESKGLRVLFFFTHMTLLSYPLLAPNAGFYFFVHRPIFSRRPHYYSCEPVTSALTPPLTGTTDDLDTECVFCQPLRETSRQLQ